MPKIFQLDDYLSNKIAAGEVVERPASVVKELVENAIDADSSVIRVDTEEGGLLSIRVLDDGGGIEKGDLETAFHRHATSKIRHDRDLFRIKSLGFRGEALPSIASVSKLTIKTSTGEHEGHEMRLEGGHIKEKKTTSPRKGTEIQVTDLFYNTPARLKYLKTVHTELGHISDVMNRMALAHPRIAFMLTHNRKPLLQTTGNGDLKRVIASIYGSGVAKKLVRVEAESLDFSINGFVAKPEVTRSSRSYMSSILNGRYVKNFAIMKAVQEGYHTLLPIGKFPLAVLHINMNPLLLDVNVHPSKLEVRISKEQQLKELITSMIKDAFKGVQLIPDMGEKKWVHREKSEQISFTFEHDRSPEKKNGGHVENLFRNTTEQTTDFHHANAVNDPPQPAHTEEPGKPDEAAEQQTFSPGAESKSMADKTGSELPSETDNGLEAPQTYTETSATVPVLYPIGQLHGTYILAQNDEGLYMVDQHAAQERIKYEYFRDKLSFEADYRLQELLVPLTFEMTAGEETLVTEHRNELEQVGLFLEPFGSKTYMVRSCPVWFPDGQEESIISEMLEQLKQEKAIHIGRLREDAAILMSCKAAIKANRYLTKDEMFQLLETLRTCEEPYTCPHGRPIIIHYSTYEIERLFKRVMT